MTSMQALGRHLGLVPRFSIGPPISLLCHSSRRCARLPQPPRSPLLPGQTVPVIVGRTVSVRSSRRHDSGAAGSSGDQDQPSHDRQQPQGPAPGSSAASRLLRSLVKTLGAVALFTVVAWAGATRPAHAATNRLSGEPQTASVLSDAHSSRSSSSSADASSSSSWSAAASIEDDSLPSTSGRPGTGWEEQQQQQYRSSSSSFRYTGFDLAEGTDSASADERPSTSFAASTQGNSSKQQQRSGRGGGKKAASKKASKAAAAASAYDVGSEPTDLSFLREGEEEPSGYDVWFDGQRQRYLARHPELVGQPAAVVDANLRSLLQRGMPMEYDELMKSRVYDPGQVPVRMSKQEKVEQLAAIKNQYNEEDFDLGIKQFMIEQEVQQSLDEGINMRGGNQDFEESLSARLFNKDKSSPKDHIKTETVVTDCFTTDVAEEAMVIAGETGALQTAWRVQETLTELSYTQMWTLVGEGHVDTVRFYSPEMQKALVTTKATAPGGVRVCKVVVPPDPDLMAHLVDHAVIVDPGNAEHGVVARAWFIQLIRYTAPFMFISAVFWVLHTAILDPMPDATSRRAIVRFRRVMMHVASRLKFLSPARQVSIDTTSPDFIPWDEIHGIDAVKAEINEVIDYLKDPSLLRLKGVARVSGVLLAGAPGTGKTLLAKSIAAESEVKMFSCSGTDFFDVLSGVGARRIRETFEKLRQNAPAILFIDEFDALGASRGATQAVGGEESGSMINELLVQMDGSEDNKGIVVLGATNRPEAIDSALVRNGRFDRVVYMPLPDVKGRAKILQVHARGKAVDPHINWFEVARSLAGFTGADCMGLMARAARMAGRARREEIVEEDIYAAMENKPVAAYAMSAPLLLAPVDPAAAEPAETGDSAAVAAAATAAAETKAAALAAAAVARRDLVPLSLRKAIAVYEAGKALVAYITPEFGNVTQITLCPNGHATGYVVMEEGGPSSVTRADMESDIVVHLAGRCAERLVMGEGEMTSMGGPDLYRANMTAREMVLECGFGRRMGPVDLLNFVVLPGSGQGNVMRTSDSSAGGTYYQAAELSVEQARTGLGEVIELLEAAEAKAYYGLATNWRPLQAVVEALLQRGTLYGVELEYLLESNGVIHYSDMATDGYGWDSEGGLNYPLKPDQAPGSPDAAPDARVPAMAGGGAAAAEGAAGEGSAPTPRKGWHYNSPYSVHTDLPEWFVQEKQRFNY